jgi:hypothetical protein
MRDFVFKYLRIWFVYWHGEGEEDQLDVFRCTKCQRLVTWFLIRQGGCLCGVRGVKIEAFPIRWWHILRLLLTPWTVTKKRPDSPGESRGRLKDWSSA